MKVKATRIGVGQGELIEVEDNTLFIVLEMTPESLSLVQNIPLFKEIDLTPTNF